MGKVIVDGKYREYRGEEIMVVGIATDVIGFGKHVIYTVVGDDKKEWYLIPMNHFLNKDDISNAAGNCTGQKHRFYIWDRAAKSYVENN